MTAYRTPPPRDYTANYVGPSGPMNAQVYLVGEAPGQTEDRMRRPFVGDSGDELDGLYLPHAGLSRSQVRVHNCWPYRPPDNRDPLPMEIFMGMQELVADINAVNPRVIVAMGRFAVSVFMGCAVDDVDMELEHGVPFLWNGRTVVPTYHPASGLHQPRMMNFLLWDWERVGHIIKGQYPIVAPVQDRNYYGLLNKLPVTDFGGALVAVDTETDEGKPWMIQTSVTPRTAYYCKTDDPMDAPVIKEWLEFTESVIYHNAPFDHSILEQCGIHPRRWTDTMQMAYLLGNEHQSLKVLAYKHLGVRMRTYSETVRPSARRRAKEYLTRISNWTLTEALVFKTKKQWSEYKKSEGIKTLSETFERIESSKEWMVTWETSLIPDPEPVLKSSGKQQVETQPTNIVKRVRALLNKLESDETIDPVEKWAAMENTEQAVALFGPMPEGSLADIPLPDAVEYACKDADMTLRLYHVLQPRITEAGLQDALDTDMAIVPYILDMQRYGMKVDADALRAFGDELDDRMKHLDFRIQQEVYNKGIIRDGETFNPNSPQQVSEALAAYGEHPKSTEQKYLEPLVRKVPWLRDHMEYKKLGKLRSTYVDNIINSLSGDGRLYTHFNMSRTDTGRLSSSEPVNLQNIPVRSSDGHRIRESFVPESGWVYTAIDYSQIEMRVAAHMSQDPLMLRMFREGLDIHGETSDRIFGDREKAHRYAAKRVGFGVMYGISGIGLKELFESEGVTDWTEEQCDNMIREWFRVYAGVAQLMKSFEHDARAKGYLTGMFGRRYYVPEAMSTIPRVSSAGIRKAGNAPIQGGAQGIIKRAMGKLVPVYRAFNAVETVIKPVNQVHDELMFEVREDWVDAWIKTATPIMEGAYPLSVLVLCDCEVGYSWGGCKEIGDWRTFNYAQWREAQEDNH